MASRAAPTPGSITRPADRMRLASEVSSACTPSRLSAARERCDVGTAVVDDGNVCCTHASMPLVDGSTSAFDTDRLPQGAADGLETGFDHVMRVIAGDPDVNRRSQGLGQRREEVADHFSRHFTDRIPREVRIEHQIAAPGQVYADLCLALVHRQQEAVPGNAALVVQRRAQGGAQTDRDILDRVVFVDVQVAFATQGKCKSTMTRDLLQHVIEETDAGGDVLRAVGVQVDGQANARLAGVALHGCGPFSAAQRIRDSGPGQRIVAVLVEQKTLDADAAREFDIGLPIADHSGAIHVDFVRGEESREQSGTRLPTVAIVLLEMRTDEDFVEDYSLRTKQLQHEVLTGAKPVGRKRSRAEAVLVGHHDETVAVVTERAQRRDNASYQSYLFERIDLPVFGFADQCAVAVDEKNFPGHGFNPRDSSGWTAACRFPREGRP